MRLLIISGMSHHLRDQEVTGWGPTAQEISHLGTIFDEIRHIAFLYPGEPPPSALPYSARNVTTILLPYKGGPGLRNKLQLAALIPPLLHRMIVEVPHADVVHVRCPDSLPLVAIIALAFFRRPKSRWVKYAGNWQPDRREALSYTLQRWWLGKGLHRGLVTINGTWLHQPAHVRTFYNPCLTDEELDRARQAAEGRDLTFPIRFLLVGRLETSKGVGRALKILARVVEAGIDATLDLVGDGPERPSFEALAVEIGVSSRVTFHGWQPRDRVGELYAQGHFMLLPTESEGWPKVLSEAMAYGLVPLSTAVSSIPQYLEEFRVGASFPQGELDGYVRIIQNYAAQPERWKVESRRGCEAARRFSYRKYLQEVRNLLCLPTAQQG